MPRDRASSPAAVEGVLKEYMTSSRAIKYGGCGLTVSKCKLDKAAILKHRVLLEKLTGATDGKAMAKKWLEKIVEKVASDGTLVQQQHMKLFSEVTAKRIRCMMRHYSAAVASDRKWLQDFSTGTV